MPKIKAENKGRAFINAENKGRAPLRPKNFFTWKIHAEIKISSDIAERLRKHSIAQMIAK